MTHEHHIKVVTTNYKIGWVDMTGYQLRNFGSDAWKESFTKSDNLQEDEVGGAAAGEEAKAEECCEDEPVHGVGYSHEVRSVSHTRTPDSLPDGASRCASRRW